MLILVIIACQDGTGGLVGNEGPSGSVSGIVTATDSGLPVEGANVSIASLGLETATDAQGRFEISGLPTEGSSSELSLVVEKTDFARVVVPFAISEQQPSVVLDVELPRRIMQILEPSHGLRVWTWIVSGTLHSETITYSLSIENRGDAPVRSIVITDTLDSTPHRLQETDIELNTDVFPGASLEMRSDGRSFVVDLGGDLTTSESDLEVLTFTIPAPGSMGIYCNWVEATGQMGEESLSDTDNVCLAYVSPGHAG